MTSYDKMVALCAIASMESTEFYRYVKSRINADSKIVPLTIQEWVTRINLAVRTSPTLFNGALDYVAAQTGTKLNVVHNTVYTNGDGGAGKSSVVGRNIANYKDGVVWLAAPKDSQVNNIANSVNTNNPNLNLSH
jgi:hypothetical protein